MGPSLIRLAPVAAIACLTAACFVQGDPPSSSSGTPVPSTGGTTPGGADAGPGPSVTPLLVKVDANVTMTANPGDGVGVFNEYASGGHWHVWWTCDTNKTGQPCDFDVKLSVASGAITNVRADQLLASDTLSTGTTPLEVQTSTTNGVAGVFFDTLPGAVVTLDAAVGGLRDGSFLFFVQDGKVNGGYAGTVTDPLELQGATP